ncbi:MAG: RidA family protein [Oligoflexales bacterium]
MREVLSSPNLPAPQFRYSAFIKAGPFYYTAGMIALDMKTQKMLNSNFEEESRRILENLRGALPDFGLSFENLISAKIYTTNLQEFSKINQVWEEYFPDGLIPPTRTSMGVAALPLGAKVEMEFVLYKS